VLVDLLTYTDNLFIQSHILWVQYHWCKSILDISEKWWNIANMICLQGRKKSVKSHRNI